jgi:hypothetical protein
MIANTYRKRGANNVEARTRDFAGKNDVFECGVEVCAAAIILLSGGGQIVVQGDCAFRAA